MVDNNTENPTQKLKTEISRFKLSTALGLVPNLASTAVSITDRLQETEEKVNRKFWQGLEYKVDDLAEFGLYEQIEPLEEKERQQAISALNQDLEIFSQLPLEDSDEICLEQLRRTLAQNLLAKYQISATSNQELRERLRNNPNLASEVLKHEKRLLVQLLAEKTQLLKKTGSDISFQISEGQAEHLLLSILKIEGSNMDSKRLNRIWPLVLLKALLGAELELWNRASRQSGEKFSYSIENSEQGDKVTTSIPDFAMTHSINGQGEHLGNLNLPESDLTLPLILRTEHRRNSHHVQILLRQIGELGFFETELE